MLPILYQDEALIAIDKPAGLLVHRTGLDAGETRFAVQLLRDQIGRPVWPAHRLDKGTSGVLLFALDADTARALGQAFENGGAIAKTYRAMVRGCPADAGLIDHPLTRLDDDARGPLVAQAARTRFRTLSRLSLPLALARPAALLLEKAFALAGREAPLNRGKLAFFTDSKAMSSQRARAELGFAPRKDFRAGVRLAIAWYRENGWL